MPSEHLKFVIPGAILSAIAAFMLLYGGIFAMIFNMTCLGFLGCGGSPFSSISATLIVIGVCFLCIGLPLIFKGISVYRRTSVSSYKYNKPSQPIAYTPAPAPSYAPSFSPSYAPTQPPSPVVLDSPSVIQDPTPPKETIAPEKKYCPSCGAVLPEHSNAHFCPQCGGYL